MKKHNQIGDVIRHPKLGHGEWIVVCTAMTGGGGSRYDQFPDGHQLTLRKITKKNRIKNNEVKFYQSGSFTDLVMLPSYITPERQMNIDYACIEDGNK